MSGKGRIANKLTVKQKAFCEYFQTLKFSDKFASFEEVALRLTDIYYNCTERERLDVVYVMKKYYMSYVIQQGFIDLSEFEEYYQKAVICKLKQSRMRRRERRKPDALNNKQWEKTLEFFDYSCVYCGSDGEITYDHFIPFSKGGDFSNRNILPCCKKCNSSKNNKNFISWYKSQKFYSTFQQRRIELFVKGINYGC